MKSAFVCLGVLIATSAASAQSPDPSKWMCRNLADSGNFTYEGETIFGTQACRPIPQAAVATPVAQTPMAAPSQTAFAYPTHTDLAPAPAAPVTNPQETTHGQAPAANLPVAIDVQTSGAKKRLFVTDEPVDESVFMSSHAAHGSSSSNLNGSWSRNGGAISGSSQSSYTSGGAAYGHTERGANPRTVELQADLYKACPAVVVTNDPSKADYLLLFRREGGKRSSMFAFGGLTGLAIASSMKVDGGSVFDTNGDMIFAARERSVIKVVKEACKHLE